MAVTSSPWASRATCNPLSPAQTSAPPTPITASVPATAGLGVTVGVGVGGTTVICASSARNTGMEGKTGASAAGGAPSPVTLSSPPALAAAADSCVAAADVGDGAVADKVAARVTWAIDSGSVSSPPRGVWASQTNAPVMPMTSAALITSSIRPNGRATVGSAATSVCRPETGLPLRNRSRFMEVICPGWRSLPAPQRGWAWLHLPAAVSPSPPPQFRVQPSQLLSGPG